MKIEYSATVSGGKEKCKVKLEVSSKQRVKKGLVDKSLELVFARELITTASKKVYLRIKKDGSVEYKLSKRGKYTAVPAGVALIECV